MRSPKLEDYEYSLRPDLIDHYEREGFCWVITGSVLAGRPYVTPDRAPYAIKYYEALTQRADTVYSLSPLAQGAEPTCRSPSTTPTTGARSTTSGPVPRSPCSASHGGKCT